MEKVPKNKSKKSKEVLTHFNCGSCGKWWSVSEAPSKKNWWCPWCGKLITLTQ